MMEAPRLIPGDATLIESIVSYLKAKGIFDDFRHECLADVDTKSSCQNLSQRVDGYASKFLANEKWDPDFNKNELRNKLRRHIDESGMLAVGADHVVEQVINPKIHQLFLPKIIEVVHQYMKEQNELLSKKSETPVSESSSEKNVSDNSTETLNKTKAVISDPIADILSFSLSKSKPTTSSSSHSKTESAQQKHTDLSKIDKKKEEKTAVTPIETSTQKSIITATESSKVETSSQNSNMFVCEMKVQIDREKLKKEVKPDESEISPEMPKKLVKEEIKTEKKKVDDIKVSSSEALSSEENKASSPASVKSSSTVKKESDKHKHKLKSVTSYKSASSSSEIKKPKKESSDKHSEKHLKFKSVKPSKELSSPSKSSIVSKSVSKSEKSGESSSKSKVSETSTHKTAETSLKKSVPSTSKKDASNSKCKGLPEKVEKTKTKSVDPKIESNSSSQASNSDRGSKSTVQYSSSYDSSQGSDQEKCIKKERQKHFSKHSRKDRLEKQPDRSSKSSNEKKKAKDADNSTLKKHKNEKSTKVEKELPVKAAKISSRSNSFGSTSSISSSSNASKDNSFCPSDEISDSTKESNKKKKQTKEKDHCQPMAKILPPPPPPPPPSSSMACKSSSSAEMSSMEDTMSSSDSDSDDGSSSAEESSKESSSDSETESRSPVLKTFDKKTLNPVAGDIDDFYDIFLYSSSSSEFEGFGESPDKGPVGTLHESDVSVSSVHTSDLSSFDNELSEDESFSKDVEPAMKRKLSFKEDQSSRKPSKKKMAVKNANCCGISAGSVHMCNLSSFNDDLSEDEFFITKNAEYRVKRRLTLKEAQEIFQSKAAAFQGDRNKSTEMNKSNNKSISMDKTSAQNLSFLSSDDESSPSEQKRSSRRERKLNPRYASSEYTSIFNSSKETFITKQPSPIQKSQSSNSSPEVIQKHRQRKSSFEANKISRNFSDEMQMDKVHNNAKKYLNLKTVLSLNHRKGSSNDDQDSSSDEMDAMIDKEKLLQANDKCSSVTGGDALKLQLKQNNSYPIKRKLTHSGESTPIKRPCSRSSVDSSSSEYVTNENRPFNSDKQTSLEDKPLKAHSNLSKASDSIKKDLFCKQRTNNNGDILGQKEILKNSHGKINNVSDKRTNESETSKELSAL